MRVCIQAPGAEIHLSMWTHTPETLDLIAAALPTLPGLKLGALDISSRVTDEMLGTLIQVTDTQTRTLTHTHTHRGRYLYTEIYGHIPLHAQGHDWVKGSILCAACVYMCARVCPYVCAQVAPALSSVKVRSLDFSTDQYKDAPWPWEELTIDYIDVPYLSLLPDPATKPGGGPVRIKFKGMDFECCERVSDTVLCTKHHACNEQPHNVSP